MIRYLIDTDSASFFLKGRFPALTERMKSAMISEDAAISAITRAELRYGQRLMDDQDRRLRLIDRFLEELPTLEWTIDAAERYAVLAAGQRRAGRPIGCMDTLIAAHALAEGLVLVTNNERHFGAVPDLRLENWAG